MGLTKRRDSYYVEFRVLDDGKVLRLATGIAGARLKRWKVGSLNKTTAKHQEAIIKTELMTGNIKSEQGRPMTFCEWGKSYLELEGVKGLRSYQDRKEIMEHHLIPFFGKTLLPEIKPADVERYRGQRKKKNGKPAKLQTINNDHIILKHCLNVARRKGFLAINPASLVPIPNAHNERDRVLSSEEWDRLYSAADTDLKPVVLMAYQLGQRAGEILGLTWDRVDLPRGFITLRGIDTKTKKPRQVPMTAPVKAALHDLSKVRSLAHKNVFVRAGQPYTYEPVRTAFKKALKVAGIDDLRFHDLRHCAATNLRRAGIDTTIAMQIVGHKSAHMWKRYNTVAETDLLNAASRLNSYLSNTVITPGENEQGGQVVSA
jgi:integrase